MASGDIVNAKTELEDQGKTFLWLKFATGELHLIHNTFVAMVGATVDSN